MENTEIVERLIENEQRSKSNTKRIDKHDEQIKELSNVYVALYKNVIAKITTVNYASDNNVTQ